MYQQAGEPFRVISIYPTIQGEGADIGREALFLRLYGCNLSCVWCDTAYSWDEAQYYEGLFKYMSLSDLTAKIAELSDMYDIRHMVITGGEPLMHNHLELARLIHRLEEKLLINHVSFETNGTILPKPKLAEATSLFTVSPKLSSSKNKPYPPKMLGRWIDRAEGKLQFKFVIANQEDADEVAKLLLEADDERLKKVPIIFQPEYNSNNYTDLPTQIHAGFVRYRLNKRHFDIRFIPQVHKFYGID